MPKATPRTTEPSAPDPPDGRKDDGEAPGTAPAATGKRAPRRDPWSLLVLAVLFLVGAWFFARIGNPALYGRDYVSDANVLNAGKHFGEDGFVRLRFLPVQVPGPLPEHPQYYTHYPPLPDLICGALYRLGARDLATFRLLPTIASLAALWMAYLIFRLFMGGAAAAWATALMGVSPVFLHWAQSLHQHAYNLFALTAFLYLLLSPPLAGRPRRSGVLWVLLLIQSLCTFEYYIYCLIMLGAVAAFPERVWTRRQLAGIASALFVGFGLHLAQNVWALGWRPAIEDLAAAAVKRTSGANVSPVSVGTWLSSIALLLVRHYLPVWSACIAGLALLPRRALVPMLRSVGMLWWMLGLAGISYWLVMRQHSACHEQDIRHAMLFLFGSAGRLLEYLHSRRRDRAAPLIASIVLLMAAGQGARAMRDEMRYAHRELSGLRTLLPADHAIWTNFIDPPVWMYFFGRPVVQVDDADGVFFRRHGTEIGRPVLPLAKDKLPPRATPVAYVLDLREPTGPAVRRLLQGGRRHVVPGAACLQVIYLPPTEGAR